MINEIKSKSIRFISILDLIYQPCASSCKETCDTLNESDKLQCMSSSIEGCFCPKDHVFHNDSCIPKQKCLVCDKDGHVEGDIWHPDKCTKCTCKDRIVTCDRIECPVLDTICEEDMTPVLINNAEEKCCPKYLCGKSILSIEEYIYNIF